MFPCFLSSAEETEKFHLLKCSMANTTKWTAHWVKRRYNQKLFPDVYVSQNKDYRVLNGLK